MSELIVFDRRARCGCTWTQFYNDDPEFDGYDTEREDESKTFCRVHAALLASIDREKKIAYQQWKRLNQQKRDLLRAITSDMSEVTHDDAGAQMKLHERQ